MHIWKIFSTFAADLGIVPTAINKYSRVMDKLEICKVQIGTEIYKVNQLVNNEVALEEYRVMHGRRIAKGGSWFNNRLAAIQFMLRMAFEDVSQAKIELNV